MQRKETGPLSPGPGLAPPIVHEVLRSAGRSLEPEVRSSMEGRFGYDFGRVRVHADPRAAESARAVGALAYTVGSHVAFGDDRYVPGSGEGKRLLAHELAHVVQQGAQSSLPEPDGLAVSPVDDPLESQADTAAEAALRGAAAEPGRGAGLGLQRSPEDRFRGSTLPYREATELLKCNQIMKDPEYCRREVLGEEPIRPTAGCGWFAVKLTPLATGVDGSIEFFPDPKTCPKCKLIRLVQVVRVLDNKGSPHVFEGSEEGREKVKTKEDKKKGIQKGFFVDHFAAKCSKGKGCSIYYRDHAPNAAKSQDGSNDGTTAVKASLWDRPSRPPEYLFEFETCARCHDTGEYLGCVDWGFSSDASSKVTVTRPFEHGAPSSTFEAAAAMFNKYYKNK
ncbi:MAG TPA: DUF4157 domain-containing protein [Thermoanaerobaculia bacterium]|nr:DUF4157 domain-containing protein [Thermoanaerobaculia bacterium]